MCNMNDLLIKLDKIKNNEINTRLRLKDLNKKCSYKKRVYNNKESISIQILVKYLDNKNKFDLLGINKKDIRLTKNVLRFIKDHDLKIECDRII